MVVVNLTGGPKRISFHNTSNRPSFIDLERADGLSRRIIIEPGRREIQIRDPGKYVTVITTTDVKMIAVEEL